MSNASTDQELFQGSVTRCLQALKVGDSCAQQQLWSRYMERLVRLAGRKLQGVRGLDGDAEDAVLQAYNDFLKGAETGRFCKLEDREDLWQVLVMLTNRRAGDLRKRAQAEKRGGGNVRTESVLAPEGTAEHSFGPGIAQIVSGEPTPEFAILMNEEVAERLEQLDCDVKRAIALYRLRGFSNDEIARTMGISKRSVERKVGLIRDAWETDLG